jgi:hypothetical protein
MTEPKTPTSPATPVKGNDHMDHKGGADENMDAKRKDEEGKSKNM